MKSVLVTGGAGYVGAVLVPKLLESGYRVRILDLFLFGEGVLPLGNPALECVKADLRDPAAVEQAVTGVDAVIPMRSTSANPTRDAADQPIAM